ncbi:transketolase [Ravibacter arvi]|uniref:Transketolase n=1 Tax=Ravibacter arvi TaxID=2051041 RepID=A0ABP8M1A1_9BACT
MQKEAILKNPHQLSGQLRLKILEMYYNANAGHIGSSLSCVDLLIAVLFLNKDASDTFILSKGHAAASLYAALNLLGEIPDEVLQTYYHDGTRLPAHPGAGQFEGIPFATGSLGHGFPIGSGVAHASKVSGSDSYAYVVMSDGETNEGTSWEAAHYAIQNKLDNLIVVVDRNGLQGFGRTDEVLGTTADTEKWRAIGMDTLEVDGHDIKALHQAIEWLKSRKNEIPKMIIANTTKGKGVGYMENRLEWHYLPMSAEQYEEAVRNVSEAYLNELTNA